MLKGQNSSAVDKLKTYYRTCMDIEKIELDGSGPLLKVMYNFCFPMHCFL